MGAVHNNSKRTIRTAAALLCFYRNHVVKTLWIIQLLVLLLLQRTSADIGVISFWTPELLALLEVFQKEGNTLSTYIFGGRRFYATSFHGHNVVIVNGGESISNSAATTATLLQKFPNIDKIVGSGVAGGVDPTLRIGDVIVPSRWALYQDQHFARILPDGTHDLRNRDPLELMGGNCGYGSSDSTKPCEVGKSTWNYTFMYPLVSIGADPKNSDDPTIESGVPYKWYEVDPEMLAVAEEISQNVTLSRGVGELTLDYDPVVETGGNGVAGSSFVDNAEYREHVFRTFNAGALDMETAAAAHVAAQFGVRFIFFRCLSDLAGADDIENAMALFFEVASHNAGMVVSEFLKAFPPQIESPISPTDHSPGDDTSGLVGLLCFDAAAINVLKTSMMTDDKTITEHVFGGRRFYRGSIEGAEVVVVYTGSSVSNAAMSTALIIQLFPGIERIIGTGTAKGVDPSLEIGDVVIPERLAMNQEQLLAKEPRSNFFVPLDLLEKHLVGRECGGFDGIATYLSGDDLCDASLGEASNFGFFFPKTVQTPEPRSTSCTSRITEGPTRKWWFHADQSMLEEARRVAARADFGGGSTSSQMAYSPKIEVGGNAVSGTSFVDNDGYRRHMFQEFDARCTDREAGAVAHIAYQNNVPFLFVLTVSSQAGAEEEESASFRDLAAKNTETVITALLREPDVREPTFPPGSGGTHGVLCALLISLLIPVVWHRF